VTVASTNSGIGTFGYMEIRLILVATVSVCQSCNFFLLTGDPDVLFPSHWQSFLYLERFRLAVGQVHRAVPMVKIM